MSARDANFFIILSSSSYIHVQHLLAPHGALAVTAFSYPPTTITTTTTTSIFSKYSPQTSQIQAVEEASTGLCVGVSP